jgi:CheY-like chemotaxis protein/anti-sigma regulatory factor (Ser/Thr protein kinase)
LSGSNVKCECLTPDSLWPVEADEGQISQVINNLLINADQAMPEGGTIELRAENVIIKEEDRLPLAQGKYVKISIRDHGIGILKKHLSKVFDPYFTSKNKGSGLGLASAHSIVKGHDGYLTVESEVGIGTVFHVYLRASLGKKEELEKETVKLIKGTGTILLMDDEEMVLEAAGEMLMYFGYDVQFARDGHQAVELFRQAKEAGYPFAAVIMDLTVPGGMGGKKTIKRILEIDPGVKAIVSSGYSNDPVMADFRQYGFCGLVTKPYNMKQLSDTLQKVL